MQKITAEGSYIFIVKIKKKKSNHFLSSCWEQSVREPYGLPLNSFDPLPNNCSPAWKEYYSVRWRKAKDPLQHLEDGHQEGC